jgi:hypothetical protein
MSDREIMNAKGLGSSNYKYPQTRSRFDHNDSINNPELYGKIKNTKDIKYSSKFKYPDAKKHQIISFIKSGVRILGYGLLIINLPIAAGVLIFSEVIGIIEELV